MFELYKYWENSVHQHAPPTRIVITKLTIEHQLHLAVHILRTRSRGKVSLLIRVLLYFSALGSTLALSSVIVFYCNPVAASSAPYISMTLARKEREERWRERKICTESEPKMQEREGTMRRSKIEINQQGSGMEEGCLSPLCLSFLLLPPTELLALIHLQIHLQMGEEIQLFYF